MMKKALIIIAALASLFFASQVSAALPPPDGTVNPAHEHFAPPPEDGTLTFDAKPVLRVAKPAKLLKRPNTCVNSPTRKGFQATCGGYPLPPWCAYYNQGIGWFGHYWALRAFSGGYEYVQTTFTCGSSTTLSWALANWLGGLNAPNVRFTPPAFWAGVVYD